MQIPLLDFADPQFPSPKRALQEPDGLLAAGGNLKPETILKAYREGIFPWYGEDDPILWWSPSTRCVLYPHKFHQSRSLGRALRRQNYRVTTNSAFADVIRACSDPRDNSQGEAASSSWITDEMIEAYSELHRQGYAHSIEVWCDEQLAGGLYGLSIGPFFCGESMFSRSPNASKIAMAHLCRWGLDSGLQLIDCQLVNPHLLTLGAESMGRKNFLSQFRDNRDRSVDWSSLGSHQHPGNLAYNWSS